MNDIELSQQFRSRDNPIGEREALEVLSRYFDDLGFRQTRDALNACIQERDETFGRMDKHADEVETCLNDLEEALNSLKEDIADANT